MMKSVGARWWWSGVTVLGMGAAFGLVELARVESRAAPGLSIAQTGSNTFQLSLSNAVVGETYVVYRRQGLEPAYPWQFHLLGSPSQTVFTVEKGIEEISFFQTISGTNWDGDAAPNWEDANPLNPSVGRLTVTIDSPLNGSTVQ